MKSGVGEGWSERRSVGGQVEGQVSWSLVVLGG